ncbi:MAG: hypothetical protein WCA79_03550 [Anaerolineales bacterium]
MDVTVEIGAMLADAGVGAEQEADKRISAAQNERFRRVICRFTNYIVSENLLIIRENILQLAYIAEIKILLLLCRRIHAFNFQWLS